MSRWSDRLLLGGVDPAPKTSWYTQQVTIRRLTLWLGAVSLMTMGCPSPAVDEDAGVVVDAGRIDAGAVDAGAVDAGVIDAGVDDAGVVDAGVVDAGIVDAGVVDAGRTDAGLVDAGLVDAGPPVLIDFQATSSVFPPSVNKIGFNSFWNSTSNDNNLDAWTIRRSAAHRAPMIAGLIEPKSLLNLPDAGPDSYEEWGGDRSAAQLDAESCSLWQPGFASALFTADAGVVQARTPSDPDLLSIRALAQSEGLITFLQISGTPGLPTAIPRTTRFNGLFTLDGAATTGGNWYPLPIAGEIPALARAFGTLPDALGYAAPTIYAFWQEPSHTLDENVSAAVSINRYTSFYSQVSNELFTQCRWQRCPMAGAQLNSNDGDFIPTDGGRYKLFIDALLARRAASPTMEMPLDHFTIQNYSAQWNDNIIANSRLALGTRFPWTPVMMNEWDYCVNTRMGDGCAGAGGVTQRYDAAGSLTALRWLVDSIDRPDVSHVLLRETVLQDKDGSTGARSYPWTQVPILFLASMSEFRRPARTGYGTVPIIATGDDDQLRILMWNEGSVTRTIPLELRNVPVSLNAQLVSVKKFSKQIRDANCPNPADVMNASHVVTCWQDATAPVAISGSTVKVTFSIAPDEAVMVFAGAPPPFGSVLFDTHYVRSADFVKRDGTAADPLSLSHFDPRTGSVTVAIRSGGDAAERLTLRNVPNTLTFSTRFASMGAPSPSTVAGLRVDYLDVNKVPIKTVFFRDNRWTTATATWSQFEWPVVAGATEVPTDLTGANRTLTLATHAPAAWAGDVVLGVVLSGAATDATWRVDFP
ncbi:MAG: hypothetical protein Q8L14_33585 [Myxococcales bacterium]|nr:hypothetical protein [Myxococcales bacterium]